MARIYDRWIANNMMRTWKDFDDNKITLFLFNF